MRVGGYVAYNLSTGYRTIGVQVGYAGQYGHGGISYSRIYDEDGNLVAKGFSGFGRVNFAQIMGPIATSSKGDGRPLQVSPSGIPVTGEEGGTGFFSESNPTMQALDALFVHPIAVLHDNFMVFCERVGIANSFTLYSSMVPTAYVAYYVLGTEASSWLGGQNVFNEHDSINSYGSNPYNY
jgi:hypothetical protein